MEKPGQQITPPQEGSSTRKKRILVVDDNADFLGLNRTVLEMEDYEVFTAQSGCDGLTLLAKIAHLDLILLDIQMGDMSGPQFLLEFEEKQPEIFENVPVVFLSGMDKVPASKAVGFIRKPFDLDKFLAAVHSFIEMGTSGSRYKH